jgi:hypothetical protein
LAGGFEGAFERGMARVTGSSTSGAGSRVGPARWASATGGTLAIRACPVGQIPRERRIVRVIGAPPAGVAGVNGVRAASRAFAARVDRQ